VTWRIGTGAFIRSACDEQVQIAEGDSFQFPSDVKHAFVNNTEQPAEVLWIMVGPSYVTPV